MPATGGKNDRARSGARGARIAPRAAGAGIGFLTPCQGARKSFQQAIDARVLMSTLYSQAFHRSL